MKYNTWEISYKTGFGDTEKKSSIRLLSTDAECAIFRANDDLFSAGLVAVITKVEMLEQ